MVFRPCSAQFSRVWGWNRCKWAFKLRLAEQHSLELPLYLRSSPPKLGIQTAAGGSRSRLRESGGVIWDHDPDGLIFCLPCLCFRPEIRLSRLSEPKCPLPHFRNLAGEQPWGQNHLFPVGSVTIQEHHTHTWMIKKTKQSIFLEHM